MAVACPAWHPAPAPAAIEHRIVKRAAGCSPRAQRRLFGPPPRLDGQELAPDIQMLLALAKLHGETSLVEGRTVEQARAENRAEVADRLRAAAADGAGRRAEIPGPAARSPARLYVALRRAAGRRSRCSSTSTAAAG